MASDTRRGTRDRRHECFPHHALQHPRPEMGRGPAETARHPSVHDARSEVEFGDLRTHPDHHLRPRSAYLGHRRRPAGGSLRPDVHRAGCHQEHLRDRLLRDVEHGSEACHVEEQPADDHCMENRRPCRLCPGGLYLCRRLCRAVAARRSGLHHLVVGDRRPGFHRARQRRSLLRTCPHRPRRPLLGPVCPRYDRRHHARYDPCAHRPCRP